MQKISFLLLALAFAVALNGMGATTYVISDGWRFRQARLNNWHEAIVPGTVHTDLMACGLIDDPFDALNERAVQWIDKEDWVYETHFVLNEAQMNDKHKCLVFEGLDTYADVSLNDSVILRANNMFRTWKVDVSDLVREGNNKLTVYLHSPVKVDMPKWETDEARYPAINDQSENGGLLDRQISVFARKAGYHYGWDWGPRLVTSGIWRPIKMETWSGVHIEDTYFRQNTNARVAHIDEVVTICSDRQQMVQLTVSNDGKTLCKKEVVLHEGRNEVTMVYDIKRPRLWWTNGLGEQHLYTFSTEVKAEDANDVAQRRIGLRSLRLLRENDESGREFCFELNGQRVFMKGANYIPCDNFLPRVNDSIYRETIRSAVDVNMNMLRVWGGGVYEDDRFYDLCDETGLLVWQDFMFACSLYPARGRLLENIRAEAADNIRRLRNHPCLAVWCGNNECQDAYFGWGWKEDMDEQGKEIGERTLKEFQQLYYVVLPELVLQHCPDVCYTPSSPFAYEDLTAQPENGDYHYWGVWHKNEPIAQYNYCRARFFSEYGMQSFPEFESVKTFCSDPEQWDIRSDVMMSHQRGGEFANGRIEDYLSADYFKPDDFADLLYVGQLMQGDAMKTAVEAHRRDKGYCWGTLIWQINDCWPVASWSTRDYYGRWKAAHYMMRHAMDDILVSPIRTRQCLPADQQDAAPDTLKVFIVNDRREAVKGVLTVQLCTMKGEVLRSERKSVTLASNSSRSYFSADVAAFLDGHSMADVYVTADFVPNQKADAGQDAKGVSQRSAKDASRNVAKAAAALPLKKVYTSTYCMLKPREMHFPQAHITKDFGTAPDGTPKLTLCADAFVRGVFLSVPGTVNPFDDNYFDLRPGQSLTVRLRDGIPSDELPNRLVMNHLNALDQ